VPANKKYVADIIMKGYLTNFAIDYSANIIRLIYFEAIKVNI
jgi:hypothetical protein